MPAVDYKYDYYASDRKVNKASEQKRVAKRVDSSVSSTQNKKQTSAHTRQSTKDQVRRAMLETPKASNTKKQNSLTTSTPKKKVKRNYNIDIPEIKHGKKVTKTTVVKKTNKNVSTNKPVEMKLKKPELSTSQKKKAKVKAVSRVKNVLYLGLGFAIAFLICYRYSLIDERFNQLEKTKKELATAQTINEQIQADIDSQTDLSYIENYAKYQLGMQKPSNSQIVYVNVEKEDRILTPVSIEEDSEETWLDQLYNEIVKFFK